MNALYIAALCAVFALASAQEEPNTLQCISGYSVNGVGNFTEVTCSTGENSCQSKIVRNGPYLVIVKRCKELDACRNNEQNQEICVGSTAAANDVQVCHSCCTTSLCNTEEDVPALETDTGSVEGRSFEGSA